LLPDAHETVVVVDRAGLGGGAPARRDRGDGAGQHPGHPALRRRLGGPAGHQPGDGGRRRGAPAEIDGEGLSISFNPAFLLAGLDATGTERIRIELRDGLKPAVLAGGHDDDQRVDDLTYLLMPMRVS
jgi:DNA polymerase III subunit beta